MSEEKVRENGGLAHGREIALTVDLVGGEQPTVCLAGSAQAVREAATLLYEPVLLLRAPPVIAAMVGQTVLPGQLFAMLRAHAEVLWLNGVIGVHASVLIQTLRSFLPCFDHLITQRPLSEAIDLLHNQLAALDPELPEDERAAHLARAEELADCKPAVTE